MTGGLGIRFATSVLAASLAAGATDLDGTIIIKRKLTRRRVTPEAGLYQRGVADRPGLGPPKGNPLEFERSHVAVYVEGRTGSRTAAGCRDRTEETAASCRIWW